MKTIYHFCTMRQLEPGNLSYFDGTAVGNWALETEAGLTALKEQIGAAMTPPAGANGFTVLSLSRVGTVLEDDTTLHFTT